MKKLLGKRQGMTVRKPIPFFKEFKKNKTMYLMILPAVILVFVFSYIPMGGIIIAFKNYQYDLGILKSPWNGFKNFLYLFKSGMLMALTKNTILYNLAFIMIGTVLKMFFAVLISEMMGKWCKKSMQSIMLLPHFISWVVVGGFAYNVLNYEYGVLNNLLSIFGFDKLDIYNTPQVWKYIIVSVNMWKTVGYGVIFYLTAITGINPELYEAAYIDGASLIQRIRNITVPLLIPTAIILLLLSLGGILKGNFEMFYQLVGTNGVLYNETDVIDTYVFRALMLDRDYGLSSAAGLYQQVIGFLLVITVNAIIRRFESDYALF